MPISIDLAQLLIIAIVALVGIVWNNLNEKIKVESERTKGSLVSANEILKAKVEVLEKDLGVIPAKIDLMAKQLQTLEINLNNQFATKSELRSHVDGSASELKNLRQSFDLNGRKIDDFITTALQIVRDKKEQ